MLRLLARTLSVLLLAVLAACETGSGGVVRASAPGSTLDQQPRCTHCGWIESKQEITPDVAEPHAPAIYQYSVRMGNGTTRVFREGPAVRWRVGERLIVFAGAAD